MSYRFLFISAWFACALRSEEDPLVEDGASRNEDQTEDYTVRWDLASGNEDDVTVGDITFLGDENTAGEGGADWVRQ